MDLTDIRLKICINCPLYTEDILGPVCDASKYMNDEGKVIYSPKEGYTRGCGCRLLYKTKNPNNHCVCGRW